MPNEQESKPTGTRSSSGQFKKGQSGNPSGRRKSSLVANQAKALVAATIEKHAKELIEKILEQARNGCRQSQKLLLERLLPALKSDQPEKEKTPQILVQIGAAAPLPMKEVKVIDVQPVDAGPRLPSSTDGGAE